MFSQLGTLSYLIAVVVFAIAAIWAAAPARMTRAGLAFFAGGALLQNFPG